MVNAAHQKVCQSVLINLKTMLGNVKDDLKGDVKEFLVRRDCVAIWWEQYVNELEHTSHLTTRGAIDIENDYRPIIKK